MSAVFQNVLTASFHGSIVIMAVLLLRLVLRKTARKYICYLWLLAGIRLLMPFEIQSDLSLQPQSPPDTVIRWEQPAPIAFSQDEPQSSLEVLPGQSQGAVPEAAAPTPSAPAEASFSPAFLAPFLWAGIAAAFLIYSMHSYVNLRKKVKDAVRIPGGWESEGIDTAFILGFIKPRIYIPTGMAPQTRKYILAHERTHLDKGDHWIKMIGFLALALHWFNPLVWAAYILLCKDIEMACDERVVQFMELPERKAYSKALLNCSSNRIHYAASPVAFGEVSVKSRIQSILNYRKPSFWIGLLSVIAIVFVMVCLVTSPTEPAVTENPESGIQALLPQAGKDSASKDTPVFVPATPLPITDNPDWGLGMAADVHSPTTMTLYYGVNVDGIPWDGTPLYKDHPYWIQSWNGETWEDVSLLVSTPSYEGCAGIELSKDNFHSYYTSDTLDWSLNYGELPEGDYRVGIYITRNGQTRPHYAWFHIYANALTGEEAEALARCENALELLTQQQSYACLISESTPQGTLVPTMDVLYSTNSARVDFYYGEHCYYNMICEPTDGLLSQWDDPFRLEENKQISFPEGESLISQEEIRFVAQWADLDGIAYKELLSYTFDEYGKLSGVSRLVQHEEEGTMVQSQRQLAVRSYADGAISDLPADAVTDTPKDTWVVAEESPWGIHFRVDDDLLLPSSGDVWFSLGNTIGVSNYTTDSSYWLECKNGGYWEKLPSAETPSWGTETYRLKSTTISVSVDWTAFYGELSPGYYRMGKHFYRGGESIIQYAEFVIHPQNGTHGDLAEAAIAKVDAALEEVRSGNYHIVQEDSWGFHGVPQINTVYWKYNGICVTDYYDFHRGDGYSHSAVDTADEEYAYLFYDAWMHIMSWNEPYCQTYFSKDLSVFTDEEISFAVGSSRYSSPMLNYYSFFFDAEGNLTRIEWILKDIFDTSDRINVYTIQPTSDQEIQAWVEKIQAETPQ